MVNILKEQTPTPLQLRQELDTLVCQDIPGLAGVDGGTDSQGGRAYAIPSVNQLAVKSSLASSGSITNAMKKKSNSASMRKKAKSRKKNTSKKNDGQMSLF